MAPQGSSSSLQEGPRAPFITAYSHIDLASQFLRDQRNQSKGAGDRDGISITHDLQERTVPIGGGRLRAAIEPFKTLELPTIAKQHLMRHPFRAPEKAAECVLWYEGTFDPIGPHHYQILRDTLDLGFGSAVLALCFQNPLKPKSTEFAIRYEMAREVLKADGIPIANRYGERGVHIFSSEPEFYWYKQRAWFDKSVFILMGPDNFADYYQRNPCWTHDPVLREDPHANNAARFRTLYSRLGFQSRVMVYPQLHDIHSTDIRTGNIKPLPVVADFIATYKLYSDSGKLVCPSANGRKSAERRLFKPPASFEVETLRHELGSMISGIIEEELGNRESYNDRIGAALSDLDHSQLHDLKLILSEHHGSAHVDNSEIPRCRRAVLPASKLRDEVLHSMLDQHLYVEGINEVLAAYREGKQIFFVSNHAGPAGAGIIPFALATHDAGAVSERLNLLVHDDLFQTRFERLLFEKSASIIKIPTNPRMCTVQDEGPAAALLYASNRLAKERYPLVFPEERQHAEGIGIFSSAYFKALEPSSLFERGGNPAKVVIVPCAINGANDIVERSRANAIAEELPLLVKFGKPVSLTSLWTLMNSPNAGSDYSLPGHLLGHLVADLLPPEARGVYGDNVHTYLDHPDPLSTIDSSDLVSISLARKLFEQNLDRLRSR